MAVKLFVCIFFVIFQLNAHAFRAKVSKPIFSPIAEDIQGITQTADYWFISNQYNIYRVPKEKKLIPRNFYPNIIDSYPVIKIPKELEKLGYNHFGGISIYQNYLIVALERVQPLKILFFDIDTLVHEKTYDVPMSLESLSWVASNGSQIYFSENKLNKNSPLYKYNPSKNMLENFYIPAKISKIQGGTISKNINTLFLASDKGRRAGGIYAINLNTLEVKHEVGILYNRGFPAYQEVEGLTFNDSKNPIKITLLLLDNNLVEDSFHFIEVSDFL
jgi:hypothetical protein